MNWQHAADYNEERDFGKTTWARIQKHIKTKPDGIPGPLTAEALADYQARQCLEPDGYFGPQTIAHFKDIWREERALTMEEVGPLMMPTFYHEGGRTPFDAMNKDYEYEGIFDRPERDYTHWASKYGDTPTHIGLSISAPQFAQGAGMAGPFFKRCKQLAIEHDKLDEWDTIMIQGDELIRVTSLPARPRRVVPELGGGRRGPCVMPVGGVDIWKSPWTARFKDASTTTWWRQATIEIAFEEYFEPMLKEAKAAGLMGAGDLAVLFDAAINHGVEGMRRRLRPSVEKHGEDLQIKHVIDRFGPSKHARRWNAFEGVEWWVIYTEVNL